MRSKVRSARLLFEHNCLCGDSSCPETFLLLVHGRDSHGNARWTLPGGRAEGRETPPETAYRELYEETGFQIRKEELLRSPVSLFWWKSEREGVRVEYTFHAKQQFMCSAPPHYAPLPTEEEDEIEAKLVPMDAIISGTAKVEMKRRHRKKLVRARSFFAHTASPHEDPSHEEEPTTILLPELVFPMV